MHTNQQVVESPASSSLGERLGLALADVGWVGVMVGFAVMTLMLAGGGDGFNYYIRPYWSGATAPAWIFLVTAPATPLLWPFRWTVLVIASTLAAVWARRAVGVHRWWILLFSHAFVTNLLLGQIEVFPIVGVGLAWLVMQRKLHPFWLGVAMLALMTKVQVGAGLALLFTFWIWSEQGLRPLIVGAFSALAIIGVTVVIYPGWPIDYLSALKTLAPQEQVWNGTIFPLGLLTIPLAFYPGNIGKIRRARMIACITLLASPYLSWYHPSTALLLETRTPMMWLSWIDALPRVLFDYRQNAWDVPLIMLSWDVWQIWRERQRLRQPANLNTFQP
jgi:hypothetical protein